MKYGHGELLEILENSYKRYNKLSFISTDPISIPHQFKKKEDIEIAAFFAASIAWGQRVSIINNAKKIMNLMDNSPYEYVLNFSENPKFYNQLRKFVHRTFNGEDLIFFILALQNIYKNHEGLEQAFANGFSKKDQDVKNAIANFRNLFFELPHPQRTQKHISKPDENSAAKRINMFLRWMVRKDKSGVDFGIWKTIPSSALCCPLDVHSGNVARKLGILKRSQNDWKSTIELTEALRKFDAKDPVKYDFALFGLGVFEGIK